MWGALFVFGHLYCPKTNTYPSPVPFLPLGTVFAFLLAETLKTEHEKEYFTYSLFFNAVGRFGTERCAGT